MSHNIGCDRRASRRCTDGVLRPELVEDSLTLEGRVTHGRDRGQGECNENCESRGGPNESRPL